MWSVLISSSYLTSSVDPSMRHLCVTIPEVKIKKYERNQANDAIYHVKKKKVRTRWKDLKCYRKN